jgi:predicted enzyme related to lactoylglutathione lyase
MRRHAAASAGTREEGDMSTKLWGVAFDCHDPASQAAFWATVLEYNTGEWNTVGESTAALLQDPSGGPSLLFIQVPESKVVKNRVHLDLVPETSIEEEVERLTAAGARALETHIDDADGGGIWTVMQDPEGNEFCVGESLSSREGTGPVWENH